MTASSWPAGTTARPSAPGLPGGGEDLVAFLHVGEAVVEQGEHVGSDLLAETVAGAEILIDPDLHGAAVPLSVTAVRGDECRAGRATLVAVTHAVRHTLTRRPINPEIGRCERARATTACRSDERPPIPRGAGVGSPRPRCEEVVPVNEPEYERRLGAYEAEMAELREQSKALEEEVISLRRRLQDAPKRVRTLEERLLETKGQLAQAVSQNEKLTYTLREAREHIAALREEVDKLTQPPSAYGTLLGRNDDGTVDVFSGGRKMRVSRPPRPRPTTT